MQDLILSQISPLGVYISLWKIVVFLIIFYFWAWVGQWVSHDAAVVKTRRESWNMIYASAGALILLLWFTLPTQFIVALLIFMVIWATSAIVYILHRNSLVPQNETILTKDHIQFLLAYGKEKKIQQSKKRLVFITVNDNELPVPYTQDEEYEGYLTAEELLHDMWLRRVSHAEWVPRGEDYQIYYVIDGIRTLEEERPKEEILEGINYLKQVAGLDVEDHRRPQKGSFFTIRTGEKDTGWKISTSGSTRGEQLLLERIEEKKTVALDVIGFQPDQLEEIKRIIRINKGLVLVTGTRSSGVTTTLYSLIRHHDAFIQNIHSLENQILCELENVTQHITKTGGDAPSPARQLRSVLHTDPDVMMLGFISGDEMAQIATKAARTDRKIFIACEAASTFQALDNWKKLVGNPSHVAESLLAITNQRLVRILCPECHEGYIPDPAMLKKLNLPSEKIKEFYRPPTEIEYDKRGNPILCPHCQGTGYFGRTAVFETLIISDDLRNLIAEDAPINVLRTQCRKERMLFLQEQALRKVIDGTTSIQEVLRITGGGAKKVKK